MLDRVPFVAKTPMFPVLVLMAAGFIAGSTPIKGNLKVFLSKDMLFVVAVLQATTITLQPLFANHSLFIKLNS